MFIGRHSSAQLNTRHKPARGIMTCNCEPLKYDRLPLYHLNCFISWYWIEIYSIPQNLTSATVLTSLLNRHCNKTEGFRDRGIVKMLKNLQIKDTLHDCTIRQDKWWVLSLSCCVMKVCYCALGLSVRNIFEHITPKSCCMSDKMIIIKTWNNQKSGRRS